jgi:hypothetical protein
LIWSWICHYDWQVQISAEAADAVMPGAKVHETKELDIEEPDALVLASMELGNDPDAMEPDTGSEVLCHNLLAKALLSWLLLYGLSEVSTKVGHAHLDRSDGI